MVSQSKRSLIVALVVCALPTLIIAPLQSRPQIKAVVCDIGGVLLTTSKLKLGHSIGWWKLTKYSVLNFKSPTSIQGKVSDLLAYMCTKEGATLATYDGMPVPQSIADWQCGKCTSNEMKEHIHRRIDEMAKDTTLPKDQRLHAREKKLLRQITDVITDPVQKTQTKKPLREVINLLHEVKDASGDQVTFVIASNMERECYDLLVEAFPDTFDVFDHGKRAVVSGTTRSQSLKPYKPFYDELLKTYRLQPEQCLFIDNQGENCAAAHAFGFEVFHFTKDPDALRAKFIELGLLDKKPQQSLWQKMLNFFGLS